MRGYGGILRNQMGEKFMNKYDPRGSLAPRDVVARAIDNEMKVHGHEFVYLDTTHLSSKELKEHFPNITEKCLSLGIDISRDMIPVVPAAHYMCGGVKVDMDGQTWIKRLYAVGEVASTGLHGANRLASNSLIEAIVFADRAIKHAVANTLGLRVCGSYSPVGRYRHHASRRDDPDYPEPERGQADHEQLCGNCALRSAP